MKWGRVPSSSTSCRSTGTSSPTGLPLAVAAKAAGYDVTVVTQVLEDGGRDPRCGVDLAPITLRARRLDPLRGAAIGDRARGQYRRIAPDLVHNVAVKPVVYGTFAARTAGVKGIVNALMGLGWVFSSDSAKARLLRPLVTAALRSSHFPVIARARSCRTPTTPRCWPQRRLTRAENIRLIRGSGVDPKRYVDRAASRRRAARRVAGTIADRQGRARVHAGRRAAQSPRGWPRASPSSASPTADNVASIPRAEEIERAVAAGDIEYWGWREDMPRVLSEASLVCLPTFYGEGLPKALLEAAASARAIVATDVPGCREIVRPGENGWLVPPRNVPALAAALRAAIARPDVCARYGAAGRRMVEREFSLDAVIGDTLAVYEELTRQAELPRRA